MKKEVKIASRREVQEKGDFSESGVLLKEKLTFSRSGAGKSKKNNKTSQPSVVLHVDLHPELVLHVSCVLFSRNKLF